MICIVACFTACEQDFYSWTICLLAYNKGDPKTITGLDLGEFHPKLSEIRADLKTLSRIERLGSGVD